MSKNIDEQVNMQPSTPVKVGRKKQLLANVTLSLLSLGLSLFFAEVALRAILIMDSGTSFQYRIPHPIFGWVLEANTSYVNRLPEADVPVSYNSGGWRDVEHNYENPDDVYRILILGDSFMEAYSVTLAESLPRQLETLVSTSGSQIEVINLGVGGYGTLQQYLVFQEIGRQYEPDLVLLGFTLGNDVRNNSLELEKIIGTDLFRTDSRPYLDPASTEEWQITRVGFAGAHQRYTAAKDYQQTFRYKVKEQFLLLNLISNSTTWKDFRAFSRGDQVDESQQPPPANDVKLDIALSGVHYCDEPSEYTRAWQTTARILAQLKQDVEAIDSKLVVFSVPALQEVIEPNIEPSTNDLLCMADAPGYDRLKQILGDFEIDYIDLLPTFRRISSENDVNLFRASDKHWNPAGHLLASEIVVSALTQRGYLPQPE